MREVKLNMRLTDYFMSGIDKRSPYSLVFLEKVASRIIRQTVLNETIFNIKWELEENGFSK